MKFVYDNIHYRLSFAHPIETRGKGKRTRIVRHTIVRLIEGDTKEAERTVLEARVTYYVKDKFSQEAARQAALEKLFEFSDPGLRSAANYAYHHRPGGYSDQKAKNIQTTAAIKAVRRVLANEKRPAGWENVLAAELVKILSNGSSSTNTATQ